MVSFPRIKTVETTLFVGIPTHDLVMLVPEVLKWKINFQRTESLYGMGEEFTGVVLEAKFIKPLTSCINLRVHILV